MPDLDEIREGADAEDVDLDIDLSGAVEFLPLPETFKGRFVVRDVVLDKSKSSGEPVLKWYTSVDQPGTEYHDAYGPITTTRLGPSKKDKGHAGRTKTIMRALGFDVDSPNLKLRPSKAKGRHFIGTVGLQGGENPERYTEFKKFEPDTDERSGETIN